MNSYNPRSRVTGIGKRVALCLLMTMAMLYGSVWQTFAAGTGSSVSKTATVFDAAIVIDTSGSMKHSDPERCAIEGAKMFVDMALTNSSKVAVIKYGYQADLLGISTLDNRENKQQVKEWIGSIKYPKHNGTDTGEALKLAVETLKKQGVKGHRKCIILFTDGDVESVTDPNKDNKDKAKTVDQSKAECMDVALWGQQNNEECPLYILGLNSRQDGKNTISQDGRNRIVELAAISGGKSKIISNVEAITPFFEDIFGRITDSKVVHYKSMTATGKWQSVTVTIPNSSVEKANLVLLTSDKVNNIRISDSNQNTKEFNATDCLLSKEKTYTMIQLVRPEKGDWVLSFAAEKGTKVIPSFFFLYDDLQSYQTVKPGNGSVSDAYVNQPVTVECYLKSNQLKVKDKDVYRDITATVEVVNAESKKSTHVLDLTFDESRMVFTGSFVPAGFGKYNVTTRLDSASFRRENGPTEINVIDHEPLNTAKITDISMLIGDTEALPLGDYFKDTDGQGMEYQVQSKPGKAVVVSCDVVSGSDAVLHLTAKKKGKEELTLIVTDPAGNKAVVRFDVKVSSVADYIIGGVIGVVILLAIALAVVYFVGKTRRLKGCMDIIRCSADGNEYGEDILTLSRPDSRTETLFNLMERYRSDVELPVNRRLTPVLNEPEVRNVLSGIILTGNLGKQYAVTIAYTNDTKNVVTVDGGDLANKDFTLRISKRNAAPVEHELSIKTRNHTIVIRFRYIQQNQR